MESSETPVALDAITVCHWGKFHYTPASNYITDVPHWMMLLFERESPLQTFLDSVPAPKRVRVIISLEVYPDATTEPTPVNEIR